MSMVSNTNGRLAPSMTWEPLAARAATAAKGINADSKELKSSSSSDMYASWSKPPGQSRATTRRVSIRLGSTSPTDCRAANSEAKSRSGRFPRSSAFPEAPKPSAKDTNLLRMPGVKTSSLPPTTVSEAAANPRHKVATAAKSCWPTLPTGKVLSALRRSASREERGQTPACNNVVRATTRSENGSSLAIAASCVPICLSSGSNTAAATPKVSLPSRVPLASKVPRRRPRLALLERGSIAAYRARRSAAATAATEAAEGEDEEEEEEEWEGGGADEEDDGEQGGIGSGLASWPKRKSKTVSPCGACCSLHAGGLSSARSSSSGAAASAFGPEPTPLVPWALGGRLGESGEAVSTKGDERGSFGGSSAASMAARQAGPLASKRSKGGVSGSNPARAKGTARSVRVCTGRVCASMSSDKPTCR
mmetsp:Transcript_144405/g.462685  ORF Transcript_144405/g.462685 Transcript_144405/m.462685 type:complete len:421 (-) Transcript_144405:2087-3349(-)